MGFTNVAWESRDTEKLARDLTDGPGPAPVGQAGAAWVRVADELAAIANDYQRIAEQLTASFESRATGRAARRIDEFARWLQALALSAAGNGARAEEAAVANGVAVMAMPSVPEVIEARTERDMMNSLAAYNGAILNGRFAEIDEAVAASHASAADVMYRYEQSCAELAQPWDQPMPPDSSDGAALRAEHPDSVNATAVGDTGGRSMPDPGRHAPLAPFRAPDLQASKPAASLKASGAAPAPSAGLAGGLGGAYGPLAAAARGDDSRHHASSINAGAMQGGTEGHAGVSDATVSWIPAAQVKDDAGWVADVSWSTDAPVSDELVPPDMSGDSQ